MALDDRYFTSLALMEYLVDKQTGLPLAGGTIEFYQDNNRSFPKPVYELQGLAPNYSYAALPNPMDISDAGLPVNGSNVPVNIYYYPYDSAGALQLYYIVIKDALGVVQKTIQAWPNVTEENNPANPNVGSVDNMLSNSQFVDVYFNPDLTLSFAYTGSTTDTIPIGPDWDLVVTHTGDGTVTVTRDNITGTQGVPTQPPYTLSVTAGNNTTAMYLRQRLTNNPGIWSPIINGAGGYVSASVTLKTGCSASISYVPNNGATATELLSESNNTGSYVSYNTTTELPPSDNSGTPITGYVDINVSLALSGTTTLTSLQVIPVSSNITVPYEQQPVNRQKDYLFHDYNPLLQYKQNPSYLIGWDFPFNPAQFNGDTIPATGGPPDFSIGANKSQYVWDQTIVYQSVNEAASISRASTGAIRLTAAQNGQFAFIQYLDATTARKILNDRIAVNIAAAASTETTATVSLWYTNGETLPVVTGGTNNSIVLSLDANGKPLTFNNPTGSGTLQWFEVPRSNLGSPQFAVETSAANNYNDYQFNQWDMKGVAAVNTATYFAIVIGTASMAAADTLDLYSVGLYSGDIANRPAPKTLDATLKDCQIFYEQTYINAAAIGTATNVNAISVFCGATIPAGGPPSGSYVIPAPLQIDFISTKRVTTFDLTVYSPVTFASGQVSINYIGSATGSADKAITNWTLTKGNKNCTYLPNTGLFGLPSFVVSTDANTPVLFNANFHYIADARLGIV